MIYIYPSWPPKDRKLDRYVDVFPSDPSPFPLNVVFPYTFDFSIFLNGMRRVIGAACELTMAVEISPNPLVLEARLVPIDIEVIVPFR